jgi:hypothetical protein
MTAKKVLKKTIPSRMHAPVRTNKPKKTTIPRTSEQYFGLPSTEQEKWNRVVHVISKMRTEGTSLTQASRDFGVDRRLVIARGGSNLQKAKSGRYVVKRNDRLLRVLVIPGAQGSREVAVRGSLTASKLARYSDAVQKYLRTGDSSYLKKFTNMKLVDEKGQPIPLTTDLTELQKLGSAGVLSFESLYARVA